jgi:MFS family permease
VIAVLRQRDFALLWLGGLISSVGDWVLLIGLPIYVFLLTHSVLDTGLTLLAGQIPSIALGSIAGVFVDRWDRKRTLVIANCLLAVALLPVLLVVSPDRIWIVYVVAAIESALDQFVSPAVNALIPLLATEQRLVAANSLNSLSSNLARLVGPALGGVIAALWRLDGIVLADAVSFALAALLTAGISTRRAHLADRQTGAAVPEAGGNPVGRLASEWAAGVRAIFAERTLMALFLAFAITNLGEGVMGTLYPVFVNQVLHGVALQIGELMTAQAIGGLLGGFLAGWIGERLLSRWFIGVSSVLFGLIDLVIFNIPALAPQLLPGTVPIFAFEVGLFIAVGVPGIWMTTGGLSRLQASSPDAYRGRVFGLLGATFGLLGLVGIVVASTVTERIGIVRMLNIQGIGYVIAGLLLLWLLPRRRPPEMLDVTSVELVVAEASVASAGFAGDTPPAL